VAEGLRKALILPGAGARGAYQVGVLKAIARLLPRHARNPFSVIAGTSAGAINAAVLASRASNFNVAVSEMERVWANFEARQVYRADNWTMLKSSLHWLVALGRSYSVVWACATRRSCSTTARYASCSSAISTSIISSAP
jgi:predicted acylesterase/phospholipase RssA